MSHSLIKELEVAIAHCSPDRCADMVRRITDLFIADSIRYSDDEITVFDDVLVRLTAEIEISARALLASRLAPIPNAPPNVIRKLALDDEAEVACPVLARSERLDDATLVRCAGTKDQRHLLAIALRSSLSEAVTDILVDRGDRQVALTTAENSGARISDAGFSVLISRSHGDDHLAEIVGSRTELPPHLFLKLLATASRAVQMTLEAEHPQARREIYRVVAEVSNRIQSAVRARSKDYAAAGAVVESLRDLGQLSESNVTEFARAGKFEETTVALARLCDLPIEVVERAMIQDRPETILILAKAAGMPWACAKAILWLRVGKSGISTSEMEQCLASFQRLKPATAKQFVRFYQTRENRKHAPLGTQLPPPLF
jgi:uncharacterized protein (DUF2336 family)